MTQLISLQCPTCGAKLDVAGDKNQFACPHCSNAYLLEKVLSDIAPDERARLSPRSIYSHQLQQALRVGKYEIFVHRILDEKEENKRLIFVDVEYRNPSEETLSCRRNQWTLFDHQGYSYDAGGDSSLLEKYGRPPLTGDRFVNPGMKVRGWIAFTIPSAIRLERLQFITGFLSPKTAEFFFKSE